MERDETLKSVQMGVLALACTPLELGRWPGLSVPVALALPPLNPVQTLGRNVLTLILTILPPFRFLVLGLRVVPR
jgi:hypothetical protein